MLIEWTEKNYHHIAFRPKSAFENGGLGIHNVKEIDLQYGLNEVEDETWEEAKAVNKAVADMVKKGKIKERGDSDLSTRTEDKALDLVVKCFDRKVLKRWARDERETVSDAAVKQLGEIQDALYGGKKSDEATA